MTTRYGYAGQILRVDLSDNRTLSEDTFKFADDFIGGRGILAKISWEELRPGISPLDPQNKLMFMTGPLTGMLSPGSGRTAVGGIAPQAYPEPWYTRSNIGGRFGSELKYSGYDGIIVEGASERPVYIWIHDERLVEIRNADELWGLDTFMAQKRLIREHGRDTTSVCIGPAGENLSRISVILTESGNAAGQGGFGAVMGSKKLKAISITSARNGVDGIGRLNAAHPEKLLELWKSCMRLLQGGQQIPKLSTVYKGTELKSKRKFHACSHCCPGLCGRGKDSGSFIWQDVFSKKYMTTESGQMMCVAADFVGFTSEKGVGIDIEYKIDLPEALVIKNLSDKLGINQFELIGGAVLWLLICRHNHIMLDKQLGFKVDPNNPDFWVDLMNMIAYRKGLGDVLAEGTVRAAEKLGYKEFLPHVTCGFADHATGRGLSGHIEYPYWIVAALLWATDSRDPYSDSGHAYGCLTHKRGLHYLLPLEPGQIRTIARNLWGSEEAVMEGYSHKARPAIWLQNRGCITSSLPTDDWVFPIIGSNFSRDGLGDTSFESRIYSAVTGADHPEKELDKIGERIFNLERAIAVREGRDRKVDERVIPYFMKPDWTRKITLDEKKFRMLMSEYYSMRGWDVHNGRPTKAKLRELGLSDVADQLYS